MKLPNNTLLLADLMQLSQVLRPTPYGTEEANFIAEHNHSFKARYPEIVSEDLSVNPLAATGVNPVAIKEGYICQHLCDGCSRNCLNLLP